MRYITSTRYSANSASGRGGAVMILALLVLALITTMGVFAATRSSVEQRIAGNSSAAMSTFYVAEAALHHAKEMLIEDFGNENVANIQLGNEANWTWLLDGSIYATAPAMYHCQGCEDGVVYKFTGAWINNGVTVMDRQIDFGNRTYTYTVTAWDNDEYLKADNSEFDPNCATLSSGGDTYGDPDPNDTTRSNPAIDCDKKILIRAVAQAWPLTAGTPTGASLAESIQEMALGGDFKSGGGILSGLSQEFANEGKSSSGVDMNEIDFSAPDFGSQTF